MKDFLYKTMLSLRQKGGIITNAYWLLEDAGVRVILSRFFNWKANNYNYCHKYDRKQQAIDFWSGKEDEINNVVSLLADEESKETYRKVVAFRQTCNNRDLPKDTAYRKQYFGNEFFSYDENEVFIDCGAFDGDTIRNFKRVMKKKAIDKYKCVCFEPDEKNYNILKINHPEVSALKCGVWDITGNLCFISGDGDACCIVQDNSKTDANVVRVPVVSMDDVPECQDATFIKMDIEGAEKNAILGAAHIIKKNKPKLAICIYHSDDDMMNIPLLIHEMVPEYKLYVRHHSNSYPETVLYATT